VSKTMVAYVSFSFSALPFERVVRLIALLELQRVDIDFEDIYRWLHASGYRGDIRLAPTPGGNGWDGAQPVDVASEIMQIRDVFRTAQGRWDTGDEGSRRTGAP